MLNSNKNLIINENTLNLETLTHLQEKPAPFTPGEPLFWNDPHISKQMLATHLDPALDLASRRPEIIDRSVDWIMETLNLQSGDFVIDLGCGPGLYTSRLAQKGLQVTGVDYSQRSINYAEEFAKQHHLDITYRHQNYLTLADSQQYDAALLIFGDYCPLSPDQRSQLLKNIHRALKPGGHFILDVSTRVLRKKHGSTIGWYVIESGFWKPGPHLVLDQGFDYPEQSIYLNQSIVIETNGKVSVYRNWFQDYDRETITAELEDGNFSMVSTWSDLAGTPYSEDTEWIGLVTQKLTSL